MKGLLLPNELARWTDPNSEAAPHPQLGEVVSFTKFHKRGFGILLSDFLRGFLCEHGVQLHYLPPNAVLQLASFVAMCDAFLGIAPNKDLF